MAYLVTNPRHNSLKDRVVAKFLKISLEKAQAMKRGGGYAEYEAAFIAAGGKATAEARRVRGKEWVGTYKSEMAKQGFTKKREKGTKGTEAELEASKKAVKDAFAALKKKQMQPSDVVDVTSITVTVDSRGRKQYRQGGKLISKAAAEAAGFRGNGKRNRRNGMMAKANGAVQDAVGFVKDELNVQNIAVGLSVGAAHFFVAPMVAEQVAKLPYVGEWASENASYTITGLGAGAALVAGGAAIGQARYGAIAGALAFGSGLVLDTIGYLTRRQGGYGDLAVVPNPYGEIAVSGNPYGDLAITAFPQHEGQVGLAGYAGLGAVTAPVPNLGSEYADADLNDAHLAPSDFDSVEGQALMDGPGAVASRFPVNRASGYRKQEGPYSRHAGKQMHRWGWLIKLVGADKARAIAALPPQERLKVISALKRQALATANRALAAKSAPVDFSGFGAMGAMGAGGAHGAAGAYGADITLGAGF
jgi:hypothetical protein